MQCWLFALATPTRALQWITLAVVAMAAFHGLLRPGVACRLKARDCRIFQPGLAVLALASLKTRATAGRNQFAVIRDEATVSWLRWLTTGMPPGYKLWPSTTRRFAELFEQATCEAGLGSLRLTPASLRPGGATAEFQRGTEIARIQFVGRWICPATLSCYIQVATATLVLVQCADSPRLLELRGLWQVVREPPAPPWTAFFSRAGNMARPRRRK